MPSPGTQLYFLALVPASPIYEHVQEYKEYVADNFASKAALRSPPHITLHMPFEWREKKEEQLINSLNEFISPVRSLNLILENFGCFEPKVIYIHVNLTEELKMFQQSLAAFCRKELNLFNANYQVFPYHPHITIAFRDLKKDDFQKAWEEFRHEEYEDEFIINQFCLLKHDGKKWNVLTEFSF
ncbi:MAG: 2'-5' RNA ligase family protein [Flammeovirgaceae bacterium]|nr:2'-5' RNA ligase family protein [Flammeovirgaceae bacterium]